MSLKLTRSAPPKRKRKRLKPRRGRVVCRAFLAWMHANNICLVKARGFDGCSGRGTVHHVRRFGSPKNDRRCIYLCEAHHLHDAGPNSIERGKARFERIFGIDIEAEIVTYNARYDARAAA